jgi:hypothetical protein
MSRPRRKRGQLAVWATTLWLIAGAVCAQDATTQARTAVAAGLEARRQGHDQDAIVLFQQAYAVDPRASTAAQIAFALQALGQWMEAEVQLNRVRAMSDPWIVRHRVEIEDALQMVQAHLGSVFVSGQPQGAQVMIGGRLVGQLPLEQPIRVPVGTTTVTVSADGYYPVERSVLVTPNSQFRESVELVPRPAEHHEPTVVTPIEPRAQVVGQGARSTVDHAPTVQTVPVAQRSNTLLFVGSTLGVVGGLAMIGAGPLLAIRNGAVQRLFDLGCVETMSSIDCAHGPMDSLRVQIYGDAQAANSATTALLVTGGVLLTAAISTLVIYALSPSYNRPLARPQMMANHTRDEERDN